MNNRLYYIHDPMCSWCWAFRPTLHQLRERLPQGISFQCLLGGLAADSDALMTEDLRRYLTDTWKRIQQNVPGTLFNFDFWTLCQPRRSTYPACRAVIAARRQGQEYEEPMILAIQQAYYLEARNPSDKETLVDLARQLSLDSAKFAAALDDEESRGLLRREITQARAMGVDSYPALILDAGGRCWRIPIDYNDATAMLDTVESILL